MASNYSIDAVFRAVDRFTAPINKMDRRTKKFTRDFGAAADRVSALWTGSLRAVKRVAAAAGVAAGVVGLLAYDVIKTGMSFEQAMSGVAAKMGTTVNAIDPLKKKALELGATTKFTATEAAQAMMLLGQQGRSQEEILKAIGPLLQGAAAENMELATTADIVGKALSGMGLKADSTKDVMDLLVKASQSANTTVPQLGEGLANVAPTAKNFGIEIKDVVKMLAVLQDSGIDASTSGTALAKMLNKLAAPTDKTKAEMRKMGVTFEDAAHNMLAPEQVLRNLVTVADKAGGNMKKSALFVEMFGDRGLKAAMGLQEKLRSGEWDTITGKIDKFGDAAGKTASVSIDNLSGDVTILNSALDGLKTKLFDQKKGPLRDVVKGLTDWISANETLINQKLGDAFEWIKPLAQVFGAQFLTTIGQIYDTFVLISKALPNMGEQGDTWKDFAKHLGTVAAVAVGVVAVFVVAAAGIIGALVKIGSVVGNVAEWFKAKFWQIVQAVVDTFKMVWSVITDQKTTIWEKMKELATMAVKGWIRGITELISRVEEGARDFALAFLRVVKKTFGIQSPSKEMEGSALNVGRGWVKGLDAMSGESQKAMDRLTSMPSRGPLRLVYSSARDPERRGEATRLTGHERAPLISASAAQVARSVEESTLTRNAVVTVEAKAGTNAEITKQPKGSGVTLQLKPTGTFDP